MAAKGSIAKEQLIKSITEGLNKEACTVFSPDGKELRVDMVENGNPVQIKITLTAVKSPISNSPEIENTNEEQFSMTDDEKNELADTLKEMGVTF